MLYIINKTFSAYQPRQNRVEDYLGGLHRQSRRYAGLWKDRLKCAMYSPIDQQLEIPRPTDPNDVKRGSLRNPGIGPPMKRLTVPERLCKNSDCRICVFGCLVTTLVP